MHDLADKMEVQARFEGMKPCAHGSFCSCASARQKEVAEFTELDLEISPINLTEK